MIRRMNANFQRLREKAKGWKTAILGSTVGLSLALFKLVEQLSLVDPATMLPKPWGQRVALGLSGRLAPRPNQQNPSRFRVNAENRHWEQSVHCGSTVRRRTKFVAFPGY